MTYISLQALKHFLQLPQEELFFSDKAKVAELIDSQYAANRVFLQGERTFTLPELAHMLMELKDEALIVFDQWVYASPNLYRLLAEGKAGKNDFNPKLEEHFLFNDFKRFITPFLVPELNRVFEQNPEKFKLEIASYIPLLTEQGQFIVQDKLTRKLDADWKKALSESEQLSSSTDFNEKFKPFFLPQQLEVLNFFTKAFYAHKVQFSEQAIELFKHPLATAPYVLWITKQLQLLKLNPEHREKLQEVHFSLMKGEQVYFAQKARIRTWTFPKVAGMVAILALVGLSIFFLVNYAGVEEKEEEKTATSFSKFSKEDRMQLDSLIRTMEKPVLSDEDYDDQQNTTYLHLTPVQVEIEERIPLRNKLAEQYVQDCIKAYDLNEMNLIDSCTPYPENTIAKLDNAPFLPVSRLAGDKPFLLKNESDYQVQVLLFDENDDEVYTAFVLPDETLKCKISEGLKVILIAGGNLGKAEFPKLAGISKFYKHHFCFMDGNFLSQLFQVYTVKPITQNEVKILLNSTPNQQLYLVDLYEALEAEN